MNTRFAAYFLLSAFGLHLAWEFAQCGPFYVAGKFPLTLRGMLYVTVADVGLSAVLYALVALGARDVAWAKRQAWTPMVALAALGAALAVAIELHAVATGRWSYSELMPLVPFIGAGVLPVLQLALVTAAATWIGHYLSARTAGSNQPPDKGIRRQTS